MEIHITKIGYLSIFCFFFSVWSPLVYSQEVNLSSVKFPQKGYIEYSHTYHPLARKDTLSRNFKLWYIASINAKSINQFVLSDSLETIVYSNNVLQHYINKTRIKYIDTLSNSNVYSQYQHKLSLPHISPNYLFLKNIERGNLTIKRNDDSMFIKIDVIRIEDTTNLNRFSITSEFVDSVITKYSYTNFKTWGDSSVLVLKYKMPAQIIEDSIIDSLAEFYNSQFESYESVFIKSYSLKPVSQLSKQYPSNSILTNLADSVINIFDTSAKLIILDFWYMGCAPCIKAIPFINKIHNIYYSKGVRVYGINQFDTSKNAINAFIERKGINYPILLHSDNSYFKNFDISIFPTILVLDRNGNLIFRNEGYSIDQEKTIEEILITNLEKNR